MDLDDPVLLTATRKVAKALAKARDRWTPRPGDEEAADAAAEARQLATEALTHLEEGRWEDASGAAEACLSLEEAHGRGTVWRDFALLVEEAAEIGRDL